MTTQQRLFNRYLHDMKPGTLAWIGIRPKRREPMVALHTVQALVGAGLEGDHRCTKSAGSARQATLISEEYIGQIEHFSHHAPITPGMLRRNLVIRNLNLALLRHQRFTIGDALFEASGLCQPCSRMDETVGEGTVAAMLGHGGLCLRILREGRLTVGDDVTIVPPEGYMGV
jgi:MOSC domain-containing protein YiiM